MITDNEILFVQDFLRALQRERYIAHRGAIFNMVKIVHEWDTMRTKYPGLYNDLFPNPWDSIVE